MVCTCRRSAKGGGENKAGPARPQPLQPFARYPEDAKPWDGIPVIIDGSVGYRSRCHCCRWHCHDSFPAASRSLQKLYIIEGFDLLGKLLPCCANCHRAISHFRMCSTIKSQRVCN